MQVDREGYTIRLYPAGSFTEVHLDLQRWSKTIYRNLKRDVVELASAIEGPILTTDPGLSSSQRLISRLGFRKVGHFIWSIN